jgi:hypothetical protein
MQFIVLLPLIGGFASASLASSGEDIEGAGDVVEVHRLDSFYFESTDSQGRFPRTSFSSGSSTINLRNDVKWIELENSGLAGSFLSVELKAALEIPSILDISDMDLTGNIFEVYDYDNTEPLGSTSISTAAMSTNGESEDVIKVRWSNGRIVLTPGEHRLRIKVVRTSSGGKIGIRLSPAEVIDAPIIYKKGKVKLCKDSSSKAEDWSPLTPVQKRLKLFLIKSKLPANSMHRACKLFGGVPAVLQRLDLSTVIRYLLKDGGLLPHSRIFIDDFDECKHRYENSAFFLQIGKSQGTVGRMDMSGELEHLSMEYVLCQADINEVKSLFDASARSNTFAKSSATKDKPRFRKTTVSRTFYGRTKENISSSSSSGSEYSQKRKSRSKKSYHY